MRGFVHEEEARIVVKQTDDGVEVEIHTDGKEETVQMHDADELSIRVVSGIEKVGSQAYPAMEDFEYRRFKKSEPLERGAD